MLRKKKILSHISLLHYYKLFFRSALFFTMLILYIIDRSKSASFSFSEVDRPVLMWIIWVVFLVEMVLRFFPSKLESMGCQKQFKKNYLGEDIKIKPSFPRSVAAVALFWILLNGVIAALFYTKVIDEGALILISLFYAVCDMICILFFCPFHSWFMKNKCCGSCRIYNWDYAMMFTPLVFINNVYTLSLFICAVFLLIRWEVTAYLHPERFSEETNPALSCANCKEKLCHHKKHLRGFLLKNKHLLQKYKK